jgi:hypothetical protein
VLPEVSRRGSSAAPPLQIGRREWPAGSQARRQSAEAIGPADEIARCQRVFGSDGAAEREIRV